MRGEQRCGSVSPTARPASSPTSPGQREEVLSVQLPELPALTFGPESRHRVQAESGLLLPSHLCVAVLRGHHLYLHARNVCRRLSSISTSASGSGTPSANTRRPMRTASWRLARPAAAGPSRWRTVSPAAASQSSATHFPNGPSESGPRGFAHPRCPASPPQKRCGRARVGARRQDRSSNAVDRSPPPPSAPRRRLRAPNAIRSRPAGVSETTWYPLRPTGTMLIATSPSRTSAGNVRAAAKGCPSKQWSTIDRRDTTRYVPTVSRTCCTRLLPRSTLTSSTILAPASVALEDQSSTPAHRAASTLPVLGTGEGATDSLAGDCGPGRDPSSRPGTAAAGRSPGWRSCMRGRDLLSGP